MALSEEIVNSAVPRPIAYLEGTDGQLYQKVALVDDSGVVVSKAMTPAHSQVDVGATSTSMIGANASRRYLLIINDSDTVIYLNLTGAAAVVNRGVRINANGSNYEMSATNENLVIGAITAIHGGAGNKSLLVTEGT